MTTNRVRDDRRLTRPAAIWPGAMRSKLASWVCLLLLWCESGMAAAPPGTSALTDAYLLAPKAFHAAAQRVRPAVVTLYGFGGTNRERAPGIGVVAGGPTTGLIVSEDGYILTSTFNLLARPPVITVELHDGSQYVAELLGRDDVRKICLLKIAAPDPLPVPTWLGREHTRVGQWVVAVGVGLAGRPAISTGIVSAQRRIHGRALQTDAKISPVNYGGPLTDIEGRVMGICVPLHPQAREVAAGAQWYDSGIGFAVPILDNLSVIDRLKTGEVIQPGWLGVRVRAAAEEGGGVVVTRVLPDGPAEAAGFQPEDRLLEIDGEPVADPVALARRIGGAVAGDELSVLVERDGEQLLLPTKLSGRPAKSESADGPPRPGP